MKSSAGLDWNAMSLPEFFVAACATGLVRRAIELARDEDLGAGGDVTSASMIPVEAIGRAALAARAPGVVAGLACAPMTLEVFGGRCRWAPTASDGERIEAGRVVGEIAGPLRDILAIERTLLNLVCRLSGVATLTSTYVEAVRGTRARICDTRKTTPGLRMLEKYAVRCGGGASHRMGLHDAALLKDNHLAHIPAGGLGARITQAAALARQAGSISFVEVEVDTLDQLREVLALAPGVVDYVLLDNMAPATMREAVRLRDAADARVLLEASGGVSLDTVRAIAAAGVDRISVGRLTHSAPAMDFGLDML